MTPAAVFLTLLSHDQICMSGDLNTTPHVLVLGGM